MHVQKKYKNTQKIIIMKQNILSSKEIRMHSPSQQPTFCFLFELKIDTQPTTRYHQSTIHPKYTQLIQSVHTINHSLFRNSMESELSDDDHRRRDLDFYRRQNNWFCNARLPSDIVIEVDDMCFHLHKARFLSSFL